MHMKKSSEDFVVESTPVIDLRKHGLPANEPDESANDGPENWSNEKTEVYVDAEDESGSAHLIGSGGETYPITAFPFVIGRGTECDLVTNGKGVSRKHAEIVYQSGRFVINDLDSLNGIKINGFKVNRVILEEGDTIKLGDVSLEFSSGASTEPKEKGRKKRKGKAKTATTTSGDAAADPFGGDKRSKVKLIALGVVVIVSAGGAYLALQNLGGSSQPQVAGQLLAPQGQNDNQSSGSESPTSDVTNPQPAFETGSTTTTPHQATQAAPPPSISAPPPSLASLPVKSDPTAKVSEPDPEPVEPKPVAKKPVTSPNLSSARTALAKADARYLEGDADSLFKELTKYANDSRLPSDLRGQLKKKHETLARLHALYNKGKSDYVGGDKLAAFQNWTAFLEQEKALFSSKRSVYADQVAPQIIEVIVAKGNEASSSGQHREAYQLWEKALSLGDSVAARIALENTQNKARQLYRQGLRLEYVDAAQARALWREVTELVPEDNEFHNRALTKLKWYERWGS